MAIDIKKYAEELMAGATGVSDEQKQVFIQALSDEKVAKRLSDDVLRQQDYSRNMDELSKQKKQSTDYYQNLLNWENQRQEEWKQLFQTAGQQLQPGQQQTVQPVQQDYLSKKDFEEALNKRLSAQEGQYLNLLKLSSQLVGSHMYEFKEPLDTNKLVAYATEKQMPLEQAYNDMVSERRAEVTKQRLADQLKQAREEGAREFASTHKIPIDTKPRESFHLLLDKQEKPVVTDYEKNSGRLTPQSERTVRDNFVDEWNKQGAADTSGG